MFRIARMQERHLPEVDAIDEACSHQGPTWSPGDWEWFYRNGPVSYRRVVAQWSDASKHSTVLGFSTARRRRAMLELIQVAVHADCRRCLVGTSLVEHWMLESQKRGLGFIAWVDEYNDPMLLLLRKLGLVVIQTATSEGRSSYQFMLPTA